jgi:hypothetical protein
LWERERQSSGMAGLRDGSRTSDQA